MNEREMNDELRDAMVWLTRLSPRDPELVAEALVFLWRRLQRPGKQICHADCKEALWKARHRTAIPGTGRQPRPLDAYKHLGRTTQYTEPADFRDNPFRLAMAREGARIVLRMAGTHTERQVLLGLLLGEHSAETAARLKCDPATVRNHKRRLRWRLQTRFPEYVGM